MKLAIQGCSHGELDAIYSSLLRTERQQNISIDALLLCGDFQAVRNHSDLRALNVPPKYLRLGDFHAYYSGAKLAPILTLVIGGNHEASNYMHELYHGGWLAPNIYFIGAAGVVELNGLVVSGVSGIYNRHNYRKGRFEKLPYDANALRSCYHTREFDVVRLKAMKHTAKGKNKQVDVVMSHDWPNTIEQWGDTQGLIRKKPFFKDEIQTETLGSPPLMELMKELKPTFWFSAHLHVKFAAMYNHNSTASASASASASAAPAAATQVESNATKSAASASVHAHNVNPEAIDIDLDSEDDNHARKSPGPSQVASQESNPFGTVGTDTDTAPPIVTRFLALHKCLSATPFLQIIDHPSPYDLQLEERKAAKQYQQRIAPTLRFNKRWLAITRAYHPHFSLQFRQQELPDPTNIETVKRIQEQETLLEQNLASFRSLSTSNQSAVTSNIGKRKQDELEGSRIGTSEISVEDGGTNEIRDQDANNGVDDDDDVLSIYKVQRFVRTAPAPHEPNGLSTAPPAWYTNPQTEAFCALVGIENRINPRPSLDSDFASLLPVRPDACIPPTLRGSKTQMAREHQQSIGARQQVGLESDKVVSESAVDSNAVDPNALDIGMDEFDDDDASHCGKIEEGEEDGQEQGERMGQHHDDDGVLRLSDGEDELHARWKEGTG